MNLGHDPNSGDLPFLQHFNAWRSTNVLSDVPTIRELYLSPYMARAASVLLDSHTVRLYQDSLFIKRPGDGWTTFWIPLQDVPCPEDGGTGLHFVNGSHCDVVLPYWNGLPDSGHDEHDRLDVRYGGEEDGSTGGVNHHMLLEVGSVTVHNGWTLHCADGADINDIDRYALSITYVDGRAELREDVLSSPPRTARGDDDDDDVHGVTKKTSMTKDDKEDVWSIRSHPMVEGSGGSGSGSGSGSSSSGG
ncbi:hypothetical protein ACHAXA_007563 [Cyclostephanos tholiformis]|uniref:Phytanoyl-CoA dioxygenase n=1 Tax=Cyclostephanos tholiformis TaxID=382380 RepID=A0ABD3SRP8_9STRA